jgi:hypothetical protein
MVPWGCGTQVDLAGFVDVTENKQKIKTNKSYEDSQFLFFPSSSASFYQ